MFSKWEGAEAKAPAPYAVMCLSPPRCLGAWRYQSINSLSMAGMPRNSPASTEKAGRHRQDVSGRRIAGLIIRAAVKKLWLKVFRRDLCPVR